MCKMFVQELCKAAAECGIKLSEKQTARFARYYEMLTEWNGKMNLTAITAPREVAVKHIIDSLSAYDKKIFLPGTRLLDLGTGAGFPGLPLKILCEDINLTLLDSLAKRLKFLSAVTEELGIEAQTVHARAEEAGQNPAWRERYDIVTSRAVANMAVLAEYALPLVKIGGFFVALKGAKYAEEIAEGMAAIKKLGGGEPSVKSVALPGLVDKRAVIIVPKIKETPAKFPRAAGLPIKKPLK